MRTIAGDVRYYADFLLERQEIPVEAALAFRATEHALVLLADAVETMQRRERFEPESYL